MTSPEDVLLAPYTTFRIGGPAQFFKEAKTEEDIHHAISFVQSHTIPLLPLGGGANILVPDKGVHGLVLKIEIGGVVWKERETHVELLVGSGQPWDLVVKEAAGRGLWGIENLAGIPGTMGGATVQNIGAYGTELSEIFVFADTINAKTGEERRIAKEECAFGYRDSIFKKHPELIITRVGLILSRTATPKLSYPDLVLAKERDEALETPYDIAQTVRAIRARKFPDISMTGTAGSFFKNPLITKEQALRLTNQFPDLRQFPQQDGRVKIALAWVLDHALHLRGFTKGPVRLFERQPLVIVAERGATSADVDELAKEVAKRVFDATNIVIEREVETFGARKNL